MEELLSNIKYGFLRAQFSASKRYMKRHNIFFLGNEIFHYTDLNGLLGIIQGRGFWLSEAKFLNDAEELLNGERLTKNLINKLIRKQRYACFANILYSVIDKLENFDYKNKFIASFSLKADDLEQWRAYAKNGSGVCIGFNIKKQTTYPHFPFSNIWMLYKVIYCDKIKTWILHSIIFQYFYEYKKDISNKISDIDEIYIDELSNSLASVFINFKNKAFESEQEVRLIYNMGNPLDLFNKKYYRNVNNVLVPYICTSDTKLKNSKGEKLVPDLLPISNIIVGPTAKKDVMIDSIRNFLEDMEYSTDIVKASSIPYRG